jgi:hypothetical protein
LLYPTLELWVVFMSMIRITVVAAQTRATRPVQRKRHLGMSEDGHGVE